MTLVKICGIRTEEEGRCALAAGADWLGFVLWHGSKRALTVQQAAGLVAALRATSYQWSAVGVFVDPPLVDVERALDICGFDLVQLSGHEDRTLVRSIRAPVVKAVHVRPGQEASAAGWVRDDLSGAAVYLLDTHRDGWYGGTGATFEWEPLADLGPRCFVAGGLRPDNVARAIEVLRPRGVDVSGGVEHPGGGKDPAAMRAFVQAVRQHDGLPPGARQAVRPAAPGRTRS